MGITLSFSRTCHPQSDGQLERMIHTLEDMIRECVMDFSGSWDKRLLMIGCPYNNSFHYSMQMASFEALYGCNYRSPICRVEVGV